MNKDKTYIVNYTCTESDSRNDKTFYNVWKTKRFLVVYFKC